MCFMCVASLCSSWCLVHCSVLFTGTGVWSACVCTFVLRMLRVCQHRHRGSMWKNYDMCHSRFTHSNHSSLPSVLSGLQRGMSGLWECQCAESAGGEQWLRCAASLFGRLHAAFQRGPPSAFGSCEPCWPGLFLVVTDPLCPHCLQLVRPLRSCRLSGSNWCLGSCWSKVPSWLWSPGNFPSSEALQSLPTCLSISLSACLAAPTHGHGGKGLTSVSVINPAFLIWHDSGGLSLPCFFKKNPGFPPC